MADPMRAPSADRTRLDVPAGVAVLGGAVAGGLAGYLLLTNRGLRAVADLEQAIERLVAGIDTSLDSWARARHRTEARNPSLPFGDSPIPRRASAGVDLT